MPLLFMRSELTLGNPSIRKLWLLFLSPWSNNLELPTLFSLVELLVFVMEQYLSKRGLYPTIRSVFSCFSPILVLERRIEGMN